MGYAAENQPAEDSALGSMGWVDGPPDIDQWTIWAAGYGGYSLFEGDLSGGTHDSTIRDSGFAFGFERNASPDLMIGLALSIGATNFALSDGLGSGDSETFQAALYGRKDFDNAYVSLALAYGLNNVTTDRFVTIGGVDHFQSQFIGHDLAADIEAGYKLGAITPYLALRGQAFLTPAYSEETISGSETFALAYEPAVVLTGRTEVGVRIEFSSDFEGGVVSFNGGVALAHTRSATIGGDTSFQALPNSPFNVDGAAGSANAVLVNAGIAANFDNGYSLGGSFDGALAPSAQTYGASLRLGYSW
jgi:outer membrane autotransporter protein